MLVSEAAMQKSRGREGSSGKYRAIRELSQTPKTEKNEIMGDEGDGWVQMKMRLHRISILYTHQIIWSACCGWRSMAS